jgi:hypothetical protein
MSLEQSTSQTEVVKQNNQTMILKVKNYKKLYFKEKERNDNLEKKNKYLSAKIKILTNNQNKGEKDEVLLLLELYYLNEINQYEKLIEIFGEEASEGLIIINISTDEEILDINKLSKSRSGLKADCKIKMKKTQNIYRISIKSKNGANPAILNHTPRSAKIFQEGGILYDYISCLDKIIQEYIDKREKNIIGEDTLITNLVCLEEDYLLKDKFIDVLTYFVFDGSGKGYSNCIANAIITYQNDKITFIKCENIEEKKEYIKSIYNTIVLSLRDKGMPKLMPEYCKPWVFDDIKADCSIKHKGSLHIRIK